MIDDYLARRPERAADLEALVRDGRLSAGPWVAQMDEFLTSGESHIRNLEMGLARARELGDGFAVGYLPDQFGHIGQMPQILRLHGIERAMLWRGVPAEIDRSSFRWRAPDGSEVTTEYMAFGYFNGDAFHRMLEPTDLAAALDRSVTTMRPFMVDDRLVVMVGYDHAGPDATLPERLQAALGLADDVGSATIAGLASFFEGRHEPPDLPRWTGELRSAARANLLPNVVSARIHQKRERGRVEALLERYAEPLGALTPGFGWPEGELHHAWRLLLWNGAHDSACGCSHDQVAVDVDARSAEVRTICEDVIERTLTSLGARTGGAGGVIRFNPSPFARDGVPGLGYTVTLSGHEPVLEPLDLAVTPDGRGISVDGIEIRFVDEPDVGDLYTYCYETEGQEPADPGALEIRGHEVVAAWDRLLVIFRATRRVGEPFVRLEGVIHNDRPDHRLRLHLPLGARVDGSLAGSPFELVRRQLIGEGGDGEAASATWPARHVAVAGDRAVLHEGVFEYEVVDGRSLAITMLRCVGRISAETLATRLWAAGPLTPTPAAQMIGETAFALGIWRDAPDDHRLLEGWERFALPLAEAPAAGGGTLPTTGRLLDLAAGEAQLSGVRRVGGELMVRLWNPSRDRPITASVGPSGMELGPARIVTWTPST
jgi:alpha-mannosidase